MVALPYIRTSRYAQELGERKGKIEVGKTAFYRNLDRIDDAEEYLETSFRKYIEKLHTEKETIKREIATTRKTLQDLQQESIRILEDNLYDTQYDPNDAIARLILTSTNPDEDLALVSIEKQSISTGSISELVKISMKLPKPIITSSFQSVSLACVFPDYIQRFDCVAEQWCTRINLSEKIESDSGTCVCFIEDNRVFVSGKYAPTSASAYFINTDSGLVAKLPKMGTPRCQHGLLFTRNCEYVFGGYNDRKELLRQCEKFTNATRSWAQLPSLATGKNCFTPCLLGNKVYLSAGRNCPTTEVFNLDTESLSAINLNLPVVKGKNKVDFSTCSFVDNNDIVILRIDGEFRCSGRAIDDCFRTRKIHGFYPWSNSSIVLLKGCVYTMPYWLKTTAKYIISSGQWIKPVT